MVGYQLPEWDYVIDFVKQLAVVIPECRIIEWDIAITDKGVDVIEGNHDTIHEFIKFFKNEGMYETILNMLNYYA